jgi:hypothetical protein
MRGSTAKAVRRERPAIGSRARQKASGTPIAVASTVEIRPMERLFIRAAW